MQTMSGKTQGPSAGDQRCYGPQKQHTEHGNFCGTE